jgi:hypothetical protein
MNNSGQQITRIIHSYGEWIDDHINRGWQGYFLSLMFSQLPGSDASRMVGMKTHLGWFYGRLAKACVPKASSQQWASFLPKLIVAPDLPIPKRAKPKLREVTINGGVHWHGLALVHPLTPRLHVPLTLHIKANLSSYLVGSIREIDVRLITHRPQHVTEYGLKGLKRIPFGEDTLIVFPRSISELPTNRRCMHYHGFNEYQVIKIP